MALCAGWLELNNATRLSVRGHPCVTYAVLEAHRTEVTRFSCQKDSAYRSNVRVSKIASLVLEDEGTARLQGLRL